MDIREVIEKCKPFAPVLSAAVVAACVAGSLYGYKVPAYEMNASVGETQEQQDEVPVVKTSTEDAEDETAEDEEQAKGSFDLEDGVYQGTGTGYRGDITVAVKIKDKQIASIEILSASDDEPFFGRAKDLIDQIIKKQSTKVDTVSGATYSSKGIISAVKNALTGEKDSGTTGSSQEGTSGNQNTTPEAVGSVQEPSSYKDGTYYGTGSGFAGNLKVEVVISGGKISSIQIVETNDGSEYIQKASGVISQILNAQSTNNIDTVSGATFSSNGIIKAVRNALSQAAATESTAAENGGTSDGSDTEKKDDTTTTVTGTLPYNEGVYYGTAEGYNGDITVAIVIQENTLKAVLVIGEEDDDTFFNRAMDVVTQMMKKQSTEVDTVSGATYSSKGLIQAVKNALEEARRVTNGETDDDNNVVQLNTEEVEKAIDAVNELNGSDYTSASWAVVKVRLKDARKALKNATEQTQLDEAAAELNQAVKELRISDGSNEAPEPDVPESTYIDGEYPVTVLCLPDEDMDFVAYNLFATVAIRDDEIVGITNIYGDGGPDNDSYIRRAINGTSSKAGVVDQIIKKGNLDGIDTVSRATCTSQAIIDACQQALNNAKR
uniref:FMN-binding protein n=1 Tax=Blautia faecicola TaxID=2509240 RepID=UPI0035223C8B